MLKDFTQDDNLEQLESLSEKKITLIVTDLQHQTVLDKSEYDNMEKSK